MTSNDEKVIFIADSHLVSQEDEDYKAILSFLDQLKEECLSAKAPSTLVILGDFFEFWVGYKNLIPPRHEQVISRLFDLSQNGVNIHYTEGNHDFFMGTIFTNHIGAAVYHKPWEIEMQEIRVYIAHGDQVNKKDYKYRLWRYFSRSRPARLIIRLLPNFALEMMANAMSKASRAYTNKKYDDHEEITWHFAQARFAEGYDAVVIGHFHEPKLKKTTLDGRECVYVNTGCWMAGNYDYVVLEKGKFKPMKFDYKSDRKR